MIYSVIHACKIEKHGRPFLCYRCWNWTRLWFRWTTVRVILTWYHHINSWLLCTDSSPFLWGSLYGRWSNRGTISYLKSRESYRTGHSLNKWLFEWNRRHVATKPLRVYLIIQSFLDHYIQNLQSIFKITYYELFLSDLPTSEGLGT